MKRIFALLCALLGSLGLYACDYFALRDLKPGVSTGYEVRDKMGQPSFEWRNADGSLTWEFARTPQGKMNYMVTVGPDNILREIRQVLTEENFAKVQNGMTRDEIRHLLGKPASIMPMRLKRQEVWEWPYTNPHNADMRFDVFFDQATGTVVGVDRREEHRG